MATVIDSLVVLLGLDASNYKKGRETAEKETGETARKSKLAAEQITKSLTEVGRTVAGLFLGFETASGFAKWLGSLNTGEAALGRMSANIGMSAHELNRWGNATALAGGKAEDTQAAFAQLTEDFTKWKLGQAPSALINTLQQMGIVLTGANGKLKDQGQIFEELANKTARYGRQYQYTLFKSIGLAEGESNYLALSAERRAELNQLAERNNTITDESTQKAAELQAYWHNVGQQLTAVGQTILTAVTPTFEKLLKIFGDVNGQSEQFTTGIKLIGSSAVVVKNIFVAIGDAVGGAAAALVAAAHGDFKGAKRILDDQSANAAARNAKDSKDIASIWDDTPAQAAQTISGSGAQTSGYVPPANSKAARFNNPGNILDSQGNERRYASMDEGEAALEKDLAIKMQRGLKTVDAIITAYEGNDNVHNNIPAYIADVQKRLGKNQLSESDIKALAQAIAIHESGPTPGLVVGNKQGASTGNTTTVSTGDIIINAPNADPRAVAAQVPAAINRRITVAQADSGQS